MAVISYDVLRAIEAERLRQAKQARRARRGCALSAASPGADDHAAGSPGGSSGNPLL